MRKTKSFIVNVVLALLCLCCIVTGFTFMKGNKCVSAQGAETPQVSISTKQMVYGAHDGTYRGSADGDSNLYQFWGSWGGLFSGKISASAIVFKVPSNVSGNISLEFQNLGIIYGTTGLKLCILRKSGMETVADVVYPTNGKWRDFNETANNDGNLTVDAQAGDSFYFTLFDSTGTLSFPNVWIPFIIQPKIDGNNIGEGWDASKTHWENPELGDTTTSAYFGATYKYSELCDYETIVINSTVDVVDKEGNILDTITSLSGKNGVLPTVTVGNTTYTSYTVNGETVQAGETMFFDLTNEPIVVEDYETIATLSFTGTEMAYMERNGEMVRMVEGDTNFNNISNTSTWGNVIQSGLHTATATVFKVPDDVTGTVSLELLNTNILTTDSGVLYSVVQKNKNSDTGVVVYPQDGNIWKDLGAADSTQGNITVYAVAGDCLYFMVFNPNQTTETWHSSYLPHALNVSYNGASSIWWDPTSTNGINPADGETFASTAYFGKQHKINELISYESVVFNSNLTIKSESGDTLTTVSAPSTGLVLPEVPVTDKQQLGYFYNGKIIPVGETIYAFNDSEIIAVYIDKTDFKMQNGASIRVTEPAGIRFSTFVSDGFKTRIDNAATYGLTVKLGGLITKSEYITVGESLDYSLLTTEADFYFIDVEKKTDFLTSETAGYSQYNTCVVGLDSSLYDTAFTAIAYMQVTYENGTTKTFYATAGDTSRSIKQVATAAYNAASGAFYQDERLLVYMD